VLLPGVAYSEWIIRKSYLYSALTYSFMLESNEGFLMTTCVLIPTPGWVGRIHVPVPEQDIQDKVEAVSLAFAVLMLPHLITFFHATTKSTNISPHPLFMLQPYTCKYSLTIRSKMYFFLNFPKTYIFADVNYSYVSITWKLSDRASWIDYRECPRRNGQHFGRVFLMLKYTDITQTPMYKVERLRR